MPNWRLAVAMAPRVGGKSLEEAKKEKGEWVWFLLLGYTCSVGPLKHVKKN